ncbi:type II toxin-antitoxin system RelE/ParE family toxin [Methylosinus sp. LW4]|uniref:type II toxin-antitoxin system RelE/ParE family toxin n=1 Tax=Methylosinus sp. LW4 TaxID=136993 RepID=UPI00035D71CB|nr:type II toxin-antitoxin system RelE/ParE family toxin [Methylosinus sp. LW4]
MTEAPWRIRLGAEAERDFLRILQYTAETFGSRQMAIYKATLMDALAELTQGPNVAGSLARDEILPGLRTLHLARRGRRGRHFIMYRRAEGRVVEVLRILHDAMDLARHIPSDIG